jgi:serine/threonine protein kinase
MIHVACECGRRLQAKDQDAGKRAKCPSCSRVIHVPGNPMTETAATKGATVVGATPLGAAQATAHASTASINTTMTGGRASQAPQNDDVPQRLGGYEIRRRLGAGAMGEVWLGHDSALDRPVAIKVLPRQVAQDPERRKRFLREARLAAQLIHTHCVAVYLAEVQDQWPFIAMEFVDGPTLDAHLAAHGPLPWREAARIVRDAAAGLAAAHDLGLVHRDVKPANLMQTSKGTVKVVDFGLARAQARRPLCRPSNGPAARSMRGATYTLCAALLTSC